MFFGDLDLPEALVRAREEDNLVVFAGAGVSQAPPSGLPSFEGLAKAIGSRNELARDQKDRLDWYLGQLVAQGVRVHDRAAEILTPAHSRPTALHRDL